MTGRQWPAQKTMVNIILNEVILELIGLIFPGIIIRNKSRTTAIQIAFAGDSFVHTVLFWVFS